MFFPEERLWLYSDKTSAHLKSRNSKFNFMNFMQPFENVSNRTFAGYGDE